MLFGDEFIKEFPSLVRHLPGVTPEEVQKMIQSLRIFSDVRIFTTKEIDTLLWLPNVVVMPDEDVSRVVGKKISVSNRSVMFDGIWRLRWDWGATQAKRRPENEQMIRSINSIALLCEPLSRRQKEALIGGDRLEHCSSKMVMLYFLLSIGTCRTNRASTASATREATSNKASTSKFLPHYMPKWGLLPKPLGEASA